MKPLDAKPRSRIFWAAIAVFLCALVWIEYEVNGRYLYWWWTELGVGRWVGYRLLDTPLRPIAAHVRIYFLHVPMLGLGVFTGGIIHCLFKRYCLRLSVVFGVAYMLWDLGHSVDAWYSMYSGMGIGLPVGIWATVGIATIVAPVAGALLTSKLMPRPAPDAPCCNNCGYLLKGLTTARCPECGTEFDAGILEASSRKG